MFTAQLTVEQAGAVLKAAGRPGARLKSLNMGDNQVGGLAPDCLVTAATRLHSLHLHCTGLGTRQVKKGVAFCSVQKKIFSTIFLKKN